MRCTDTSRSLVIVLCLLGCNVWKVVTKTLQKDSDAKEVTLKVHVSDSTTQQPLSGVAVEVFANHTSVATETSLGDGNVFLRFSYRLGDPLVVTATRRGYVPNSAPWRPTRLPVFSSLSLDLLPERAATLMVYEDVVQIVSGYQGSRLQPWVQFQRRALSLPPNTSYTNLTALLTVTHSPNDAPRLSYLQALNANTTGGFELTPVAAISVHLLGSDGEELQVNEPISIGVPLPANSGLKENDHIPAWRFDPKQGAWLKSSLGYVQRDGDDLILTYIASQLGYWVAAMSPLNTGPVVAKDISTYHTVFLLAILGGMALILLLLLCLLLYYCRRKCGSSRPSHRKLVLSSSLEASKRDQSTSMSHVNLISETQLEAHLDHLTSPPGGPESDLCTPMLRAVPYVASSSSADELSTSHLPRSGRASRNGGCGGDSGRFRRSADTLELRTVGGGGGVDPSESGYRRSCTSVLSSSMQPLHSSVSVSASCSSSPHPLLLRSSTAEDRTEHLQSRQSPCRDTPSCCSPGPHSPCIEMGLERGPLLSRSVDALERGPLSLSLSLPPPGALLCCSSELAVSQAQQRLGGALGAAGGYIRPRPTLVIPAHYMRLPGTHPLSGQALLLQSDQRSELESIQAELAASHQPLGQGGIGGGGGGGGGLSTATTTTGAGDGRESSGDGMGERAVGANGSEGKVANGDPGRVGGGGGVGDGGPGAPGGVGVGEIPPQQWSQRLGQSGLGVDVVQMNGEDQLLAEKALLELRGGKPLTHPRAWFVSLDGRSNAHIRHSYIDLQGAGRTPQGQGGRANDASLDSGVDMMGEVRGGGGGGPGPGWRRGGGSQGSGGGVSGGVGGTPPPSARQTPPPPLPRQSQSPSTPPTPPPPAPPGVTYTQLVFLEDSNGNSSTSCTPIHSPQLDLHQHRGEEEEKERRRGKGLLQQQQEEEEGDWGSSTSPSPPSPLPPPLHSPPPLPEPMDEDEEEEDEDDDEDDGFGRQLPPSASAPDELVAPDDSGEDERDKKSPWQKREERPLLAFNLK
ncbi:protein FAM171A1 [Engraulis encrasicolus]|uniref:protein FAM171A1 n=1 Tax=Engraulis encrasicolus TaxID=184585 RepID=UPI002FD4890D